MECTNSDGGREHPRDVGQLQLSDLLVGINGEVEEKHYQFAEGKRVVELRLKKDSEDLDQFQWVREGSKNCFEALQEAVRRGLFTAGRVRITVGVARGRPAIFFDDDGVGFLPDQMERDLTEYGGSSKVTGPQENYGTGTKSVIAMQNSNGVEWLSWRDGTNCRCIMWQREDGDHVWASVRDPETGRRSCVFPGDDSLMPDIVRETGHGTRLIIYGVPGQPLFSPDSTALKAKSDFLHAYLEGRYFRIPECVDFRTCANFRTDKKEQHPRVIHGFEYYLNNPDHHVLKGSVQLDGAKVHWWVLNSTIAGQESNQTWLKHWPNGGQIAFLYDDELFTHHRVRTGERGASVMNNFGITNGSDRVVLLVEPDRARTAMSHTRYAVVFDGKVLVWNQAYAMWGGAFADSMPKELRDFVDSQKHHTHSDDVNERIRQMAFGPLGKYVSNNAYQQRDGDVIRILADFPVPPPPRTPKEQPPVKPLNDMSVTKMRSIPDTPEPGNSTTSCLTIQPPTVQMDRSVDLYSAGRLDIDPQSTRPGTFHINELYEPIATMLRILTERATDYLEDYVVSPAEYVRMLVEEQFGVALQSAFLLGRVAGVREGIRDPALVYERLNETSLTTAVHAAMVFVEHAVNARIDEDYRRFRQGRVVRRKRTMQTDDRSRNLGGLKAVQDTDNRATSGRRRASKKETK